MAANRSIPCLLCSRSLEQREDKNGKPYFVCDECGTQFFIRGMAGKVRLAELLRRSKNKVNTHSKALVEDVERVQEFIETFDDGEKIILNDGTDGVVAFPDWSREVCERVIDELKRCGGQK